MGPSCNRGKCEAKIITTAINKIVVIIRDKVYPNINPCHKSNNTDGKNQRLSRN